MTDEPYESSKIPDHWGKSPKRKVSGRFVAVSGVRLHNRGTELMFPRSRSFPKYSIVELTATNQKDVIPGGIVNSVLYLGFFEVLTGGIIAVNEPVAIENTCVGYVIGFSDIHEPNHLNVLIHVESQQYLDIMEAASDGTIAPLDIKLEHEVVFG